ncbi:ribosylnicotinamide kinase [Knufia obscura]|uniref:Ribosylnicotinamide kinase n=2 Tax=Knufia TaxID=430999 RepID=A0AAN8I9B2_9EURO|nr:ribosylnicotinamide kinase [Knufia obscura]KAK5958624.1 ribosylnicotinamide kinase [Knufia fluminis]
MAVAPSSNTLIVGLSGPSSSGKTTLARLLRQIFNVTAGGISLRLFILHEDDFYKTDKLIPRKTFTSSDHGKRELDDWDCVESLDLPLLQRVMSHVKEHGELPSDFASKEDQNTIGESGVSGDAIESFKHELESWLQQLPSPESRSEAQSAGSSASMTICLLDGFLLYPDPESPTDSQERELHDILKRLLSLKLFVPSTRERTIERRTKRTGYVTLEGFWEDPPGYVEDVVWPNYRRDHAWLFNDSEQSVAEQDVAEAVDEGRVNRDTAAQAGILVGPGRGEIHLNDILPWAVERLKEAVGRNVIGREMRALMQGTNSS